MIYQEQQFNLPTLQGLSDAQIQVHLGLYRGYVANVNDLLGKIENLSKDLDTNKIVVSELQRRLGFEFAGMRMHEYYFEQLEDGAVAIDSESNLAKLLVSQYGSFENWLADFKRVSGMRGIGWTVLYYDKKNNTFHNAWVSDHELGQMAGLDVGFAMDMWEHAYMVDYKPADKGQYVEAFLSNVNWQLVQIRFDSL
jgi:Fe-Mn family superoxide dismutase